MPYGITVNDERCEASKPFSVVKEDDNALMGCHETRQDAVTQIAALEAAEASKAKEDAPNYRPVADDAAQKCTNCQFNARPQFCERFDFIFDPNHVCDAWESRRRQRMAQSNNEVDKMSNQKREYKQRPIFVQKVDDAQGIVDAYVAVMGNIDFQQDIIENGSFTKTLAERGHKVKVLDNHNTGSVTDVIGKPLMMREATKAELPSELLIRTPEATGALFASIQFLLDTPEGLGAFNRIKSGAVDQYSIGYDALDVEYENVQKDGKEVPVRRLKTIRLWEISPVIFAANDATVTLGAKDDGAQTEQHESESEIAPRAEEIEAEDKGATGAANLPLAPRARAWDSSAAESRVRSWADAQDGPNAQYRRAFFWVDSDASENFTSYKLQFADVVGGELQAVPRGLFAVAGALEGARGGVDIPDSDKATIRRKVSAYYSKMRSEFDDDSIVPPWDKAITQIPENKAVNLTGIVDAVTMAFYAQYPDRFEPPEARNVYWVTQVWDEFIIARQEGAIANALWKVPYAISGEQIIFAQPSTWQEMQEVIVPIEPASGIMSADEPEEGKVGRAISAANGRRIAAAVVNLAELLEATGIDIPGFGRTEAEQHEDEEEEKATIIKIDDGSRYVISYPQKLSMRDMHRISERLDEWMESGAPFIITEGGAKLMRVDGMSTKKRKAQKQTLGLMLIEQFEVWAERYNLSQEDRDETKAALQKEYELVEPAPAPDEQAAIENQPDGQPTEAGPAEVPPTPEDKDLTDWIALEREALDLLKLGGK